MIGRLRISHILFVFALVLSLNLVSSQALVAGKIYNSDFSNIIGGADISVTCNSYSLNTNSLADGTYAVRFDETKCNEGDSASVSASKSGFEGKTGLGIVSKCEDADCDDNYVTIVNLGIKTLASDSGNNNGGNNAGGGSVSMKYYLCGNGKCDTGETANTCAKDCNITEPLIQTTTTEIITTNTEETGEEEQAQNPPSFGSKILGAVIGPNGKIRLSVPIVFIVLLLIVAIAVFARRKSVKK